MHTRAYGQTGLQVPVLDSGLTLIDTLRRGAVVQDLTHSFGSGKIRLAAFAAHGLDWPGPV